REVRSDVRDRGPVQLRGRVVPADGAARRMLARVVAVAAERGEVDPADEGRCAVDDHELLVVAVHRPLEPVETDANPRSRSEPPRGVTDVAAVRVEERERRAGP